jgi:hypothetical protein
MIKGIKEFGSIVGIVSGTITIGSLYGKKWVSKK